MKLTLNTKNLLTVKKEVSELAASSGSESTLGKSNVVVVSSPKLMQLQQVKN